MGVVIITVLTLFGTGGISISLSFFSSSLVISLEGFLLEGKGGPCFEV